MSFALPAFVFAAAALSAAPSDVPDAAGVASPERPQVVFQLRPSAANADAVRLLAERLAAPGWRPARLGALFARGPAAHSSLARDGVDLGRVYVADVPPGLTAERAAALLAADPRIAYAQVDHVHETHAPPTDGFYNTAGSWGQPYDDMWALKRIHGGLSMDLSRGQGSIVAVVDSGVDYSHAELANQVWTNPEELGGVPGNGFPDDLHGWDFVSNDNVPLDEFGHGTHMAGIVAAEENGLGIVGVAPLARVMPVRAVNGAGAANSSTLAAGVVYATDNGAHVILMSSGCVTRCPSDPVLENAVRYAMARGAIVVLSAGNRSDDVAFYSPQNMTNPKPIVVGASNELDQRAGGSNTGDWIDLVAPGGGTNTPPPAVQPTLNILSVKSDACSPIVCNPAFIVTDPFGTRFLRRAGTSMSAAFVAGVVAQVLSESPAAQLDDVRARLLGNATDKGPTGWDRLLGWGRLDAQDAVGDLRRYAIVRIAVPQEGQAVSGVVRIAGTAIARSLNHFDISVGQGASPTTWVTTGVVPALRPYTAFSEMAHWDTTGLPGGTWTIRVVIADDVLGTLESRRTVTVVPTAQQPLLVLDVESERGGKGSVQLAPAGEFCDGVAHTTRTCSYPVAPDTLVTLTALPDAKSFFQGWNGACGSIEPCTVRLSQVTYVRATFHGPTRIGMEITSTHGGQGGVSVDPPGATCEPFQSPCRFDYRLGTTVVLTAFEGGPLDSWQWLEGPCTQHTCQLYMTFDAELKGVISEVDPSNPITISAGPDQRVPRGTPVTLYGVGSSTAPPVIVTWTDNTTGALLSNQPQPTVTLAYGVHELLFRVTDANGASDQDTAIVAVHEP